MPIIGQHQLGVDQLVDPDDPETAEDIELDDASFIEGVVAGFQKGELDEGIYVDEETRKYMFEKYPDYKNNSKYYDAYADLKKWWLDETNEAVMRSQIDDAVESGRFTLVDGKVVDRDTSWFNDSFMYDMDAVKGAILARNNGYNDVKFKSAYAEYSKERGKELERTMSGAPVGSVVGQIGNYLYSKEGAFEIAGSPTKVVGQTMMMMAAKRFGIEASLAMVGGLGREQRKLEHAEKAKSNYGLAQAAENVLWEMGFAGGFGATGSLLLDGLTWNQVRKRMAGKWGEIDASSKDILERYFRREEYKLTNSVVKHEDLIIKAQSDIDEGRPVDVADELDIPIEEKIPEGTESISLKDEVTLSRIESGIDNDIENITKELEDTPDIPDEITEKKYGELAEDADGDQLIQDIAELDPEIKAEAEALEKEIAAEEARVTVYRFKNKGQSQAVKDASVVPVGGDEDATKEAVKQHFKPQKTEEARIKKMSKADIAEQERMHEQNLIDQGLDDYGNAIFAKFADNLAAGTLAGVEEDEQGNITFDPEKFILGLGGYTAAKALIKNPTIQKEFKEYADRTLTELETNPKFNMFTGKQSIVQASKVNNEKLIASHRTDFQGLNKMLDAGVLPAPSFALSKSAQTTKDFGDIVIIPKEKLIDPKKGAYVYGGDAWTPRIRFNPNEEMEVIDLKAPVFDMFPKMKSIAKDAYGKEDFYNQLINEERTVSWVDKWSRGRWDTYEAAQKIADQVFKTEAPSIDNKIKAIKKLIKDNGGDLRGLEDAWTPEYVYNYLQYHSLDDAAKRGKELKTFKNKDNFYNEASKALEKGEQPPADYMEAKRLDKVKFDDIDRIVVPSEDYNDVVKMFKEKGIDIDIVKQRKNESTNQAIKRTSSGKSNFIWGGAALGLIPIIDNKETN